MEEVEEKVKVRMMKRKGAAGLTGVRNWMVVTETGQRRLECVGKHSIMRRTGLPARDLRVLDPMLSHPSSIMGRERAIVLNLEHVKGIITASEVLMINSSNPLFLHFLQHLLSRLSHQNSQNGLPVGVSEESDAVQARVDSPNPKINAEMLTGTLAPKQLPFEFLALETCIESACRCLESETSTLEDEAYPALDELTSQLSTLNLERVRQIKSRLVALSGRVQKVADELEHLLDDDNDMAEMYLTQKLQASLQEEFSSECEDGDQSSNESNSEKFDKFSGLKPDVEELEMLLEAYFAQTNGILQRLSSLSEYVDNTEDYINIMLDDKQNQLLQASIIFNTLNMILSAGIVVVGLFGMNIQNKLFDGEPRQFWATTGGTFGGCVLMFLVCFGWGKKKYFLSQ
ncbi:magnesium transporter MRS2-F [Cajanus cajan]|uniref:magnesium transporter MRS2-F n=1 Tax=Cajanus cajan TaxID=3821 RepID=UPI0010FAF1C3|nr:magnesium transporter MRS2-F [Cajanus cajan]